MFRAVEDLLQVICMYA